MKRIVVTGARAPVALHWARLFKSAGHHVVVADTPLLPIARFTRFKDHYVRLPGPALGLPAYAAAWRRLLDEEQPDMVLPTCEEVFHLAALRDRHGVALPLFAPAFDSLARMHDKYRFARFAAELDAPAKPPETWLVRDASEAAPLLDRCRDLVLKPVWSRFAERVVRRPDRSTITRMNWQSGGPWIAQTYLPGEELSAFAVAHHGTLVALQAYRGLFRAGGGASVAFEPCEEPDIRQFVVAFVRTTSWHGQVAFDFRRDGTGAVRVIECNPRAVSGLHFFGPGDGLPEAVLDGCESRASIRAPQTVRLALLTYGLADAVASGRLGAWYQTLCDSADLTWAAGDRSFAVPQLLSLGEIAVRAMLAWTGLKAAATADIEWNGEPL